MPIWFAIAGGVILGLMPGFLLGRWSTRNDQVEAAGRRLTQTVAALQAIPKGPCPHCGKMRGHS